MNPRLVLNYIQKIKSAESIEQVFQISENLFKTYNVSYFLYSDCILPEKLFRVTYSANMIWIGSELKIKNPRNKIFKQRKRSIVSRKQFSKIFELEIENNLDYHYAIIQPISIQKQLKKILILFYAPQFKKNFSDFQIFSLYIEQMLFRFVQIEKAREIMKIGNKLSNFLLEHFPKHVAEELKEHGTIEPIYYESVTILFTDFVGFTQLAEHLNPTDLINILDGYFFYFDDIIKKYDIERVKTIGDSYMCVSGVNKNLSTKYHAVLMCLAALEILNFVKLMISVHPNEDQGNWNIRIGINSGPIVGGVVGKFRPTFDIWGNAVNIASRMESSGQTGRINISETTYQLVKDYFEIEPRGELEVKNNQKLNMYFLNRIKNDYSEDEEGNLPNEKFLRILGL